MRLSLLPLLLLLARLLGPGAAALLPARWAHTAALVTEPQPLLLLAAGKLAQPDGQTFFSAPTTASALRLPLDQPFALADAADLAAASSAPPYAWASAATVRDPAGRQTVVSYGGDGSPWTAVQTANDSAWLFDPGRPAAAAAAWTALGDGWAQPVRRVFGASCSLGPAAFFTAGTLADGSLTPVLSSYLFAPATGFTQLAAELPAGRLEPSVHCLANGTVVLLGGLDAASAEVASLAEAWTLDTTAPASASWQVVPLGASSSGDAGDDDDGSSSSSNAAAAAAAVPPGRRAHLGVTFGAGDGALVAGGGGGRNGLERVLADVWVLDFARAEWTAASPSGTGPGARLGAQGVPIGSGQVLLFGGYLTDAPADGGLYLYDRGTDRWVDRFEPPAAWVGGAAGTAAGERPPQPSSSSSAAAAAQAASVGAGGEQAQGETVVLVQPAAPSDPAAAAVGRLTTLYLTRTSTAFSLSSPADPATAASASASAAGATLVPVATTTWTASAVGTAYAYPLAPGGARTTSEALPSLVLTAAAGAGETGPDVPAYTGVVPGYATRSPPAPAGPSGGGSGGGSSSSGEKGSGSGSGEDGGGGGGGDAKPGTTSLSAGKKAAVGLGASAGLLALFALAAAGTVVLRRRRKRARSDDDDDEKEGLAYGGGGSGEWAHGGTWTSTAAGGSASWAGSLNGYDRRPKRARLAAALAEKLARVGARAAAAGGAVVIGGGGGGGGEAGAGGAKRRWGMLDDEDTRRFETYPPSSPGARRPAAADDNDLPPVPFGEDPFADASFAAAAAAAAADGGEFAAGEGGGACLAGLGILDRSGSFAPASVRPGSYADDGDDGGDLGFGGFGDDPFADLAGGAAEGEGEDEGDALAPLAAAGALKRSSGMHDFYSSSASSHTPAYAPYSAAAAAAAVASSSSSGPSSSSSFSADGHSLSSASGSSARAHDAHPAPAVLYDPHPYRPSRAGSTSGWRRVLGLSLRVKHPSSAPFSSSSFSAAAAAAAATARGTPDGPPLTSLPPSARVMGPRMRALRDPAPPPKLGFDEAERDGEDGWRAEGRGQEGSLSSVGSGRTATSAHFARFNQLDSVQRSRTASGTTAGASSTPDGSPALDEGDDGGFVGCPLAVEDPFADGHARVEGDLIVLSPDASASSHGRFSNPGAHSVARARSARTRPPSASAPSPALFSAPRSSAASAYPTGSGAAEGASAAAFSLDRLSPNPAFPNAAFPAGPAPARRSVRDTIAAFEQHAASERLRATAKPGAGAAAAAGHGQRHGHRRKGYSAVGRAPTLTVANPDSTPREPSD